MMPGDDPIDEHELDPSEPRLSRTQQTRAATHVNELGVRLTRLSSHELDRLDLPERLREEIDACQRLKPRSRGRQNRLIGQLLRAEDHQAIVDRIASLSSGPAPRTRADDIVDRWLSRLLEEGAPAVEALLTDYPAADRQRLRLLVRSASRKSEEKNAKRARRELQRAIRDLQA